MKAQWVTLIDGFEVDTGCSNCHRRTYEAEKLPDKCKCGCEMEDRRELTMQYKKNEGWVFIND